MARTCSVCHSQHRPDIDAALVAGESVRTIAGRYGTTRSAVHRHRDHIPAALANSKQATVVAHADDLVTKVHRLEADARRLATSAEHSGDLRTALQGLREVVRIVELMSRLHGELASSQVNVALSVAPSMTTDEAYEELVAAAEDAARMWKKLTPPLQTRMLRMAEQLIATAEPQW